MALSSYPKPSQTPRVSPFKSSSSAPPPSPTSSSMKLKTVIQTFIISRVCRFIRDLSKSSSILLKALKEKQYTLLFFPKKVSKKQTKIIFGSFRLHYNWCSSHVVPVSVPVRMCLPDELYGAHLYYDSTWNSVFSTNSQEKAHENAVVNGDHDQSQLSGYLQWLEENVSEDNCMDKEEKEMNEIDKLADTFIASCHEKFRLEKVESYRRFQEMLARSL